MVSFIVFWEVMLRGFIVFWEVMLREVVVSLCFERFWEVVVSFIVF